MNEVVADVVADPDELRPPVAAGEEDHCDSHQVSLGDLLGVGRVGL